jgi:hypothetical protein
VTHKFAKLLILAAGALGLSALPALAGTCAGGDTVTSGFTCSIGSLTFDFTLVSFDPANSSDDLILDSNTGIQGGDDYVLDFQVTPNNATDLLLNYTVTSTADNLTQVDNSYLTNGSNPPDQTLDENVCTVGGTPGSPSCGTLLVALNNQVGNEEYSATFGPESSVFISKDFAYPSSQFTDSIVATPEPSSLGLMFLGVLGIGMVSRKFRKA